MYGVFESSFHCSVYTSQRLPLNGRRDISGNWLPYRSLKENGWEVSTAQWNDDSKTPYIWKSDQRKYLTFDNGESIREKVRCAIEKNIRGLSVKRFDTDDDDETIVEVMASADLCSGTDNTAMNYVCNS